MRLIATQAEYLLKKGRAALRDVLAWAKPSDMLAHVLPQSWYVWSPTGEVTCHCILSYTNLARATNTANTAVRLRHGDTPWTHFMVQLYTLDKALHMNVSARLRMTHPSACYRPQRRP